MSSAAAATPSDGGGEAEGTSMLLFRVGDELFAVDLGVSEEVLELPELYRLAGMGDGGKGGSALGVFMLRDRLVSVYGPEHALRVRRGEGAGVVLVVRANGRRVALALDDVEEVITVDLSDVKRPSPRDAADGILVAIARHGDALVGVVDVDALVTACVNASAGAIA